MRKALIIFVLILPFLLPAAGCGSVHIGGETHTHIYGTEVVVSDDETTSRLAAMIQTIRTASEREPDSMEGFKWDNERITRMEKEQKKREEEEWY